MSYTLKQTHIKTCLHVIKRTVTCSAVPHMGWCDSSTLFVSGWVGLTVLTELILFSFYPDCLNKCKLLFLVFTLFLELFASISLHTNRLGLAFLCVSKFSSSVFNGIRRDMWLTSIPGQLSVFNAICGLASASRICSILLDVESITQYLWSEFRGIAHLAIKILMTSIEYVSLAWQFEVSTLNYL